MGERNNMSTWHIVTAQGNVILGVYGSALLSRAQDQARLIERKTGLPAFVSLVAGERPRVGQKA